MASPLGCACRIAWLEGLQSQLLTVYTKDVGLVRTVYVVQRGAIVEPLLFLIGEMAETVP